MHVLFVHQNYPAQFGHIAAALVREHQWPCTFLTATPGPAETDGVQRVVYRTQGGATRFNHYASRTFENQVWQAQAAFEAMKARPDVKPDLIVGHSGFGSTVFLRELYPRVPIVNLFEYYYWPHDPDSDMDFRHDLDWRVPTLNYLRSRTRNAMLLLDLQYCQLGYSPTKFQLSKMPGEFQQKLRPIFDGIDRTLWHGHEGKLRGNLAAAELPAIELPPEKMKIVTYVSRGFESMRGFDVFMRAAGQVAREREDVIFVVVGSDKISYGGDDNYTGGMSFRKWVLQQGDYDLSRFRFIPRLPPEQLSRLLAATDLHVYLTVPFVLSWSLLNAMSCGASILGSDTPPVREMITPGETGLLVDFFDVDGFAEKVNAVLDDPAAYRHLGVNAEALIEREYSLDAVMPKFLAMFEEASKIETGLEPEHGWPEDDTTFVMPPVPQSAPPAPRPPQTGGQVFAPPRLNTPFRG